MKVYHHYSAGTCLNLVQSLISANMLLGDLDCPYVYVYVSKSFY